MSTPHYSWLTSYARNYVLRFFLLSTIVTAGLWFVIFPIASLIENYTNSPAISDIIAIPLPTLLTCLAIFLRLRHPKAHLHRNDFYIYLTGTFIMAIALTLMAFGFHYSIPFTIANIAMYIAAFPFLPSTIIMGYAYGDTYMGIMLIFFHLFIILAFTSITTWALTKKQ